MRAHHISLYAAHALTQVAAELKERKDDALRDAWDIELPFKLKQGQIEMEAAAVVTDYGDAVLIDKGLVHALNHDIKKLAREKIQILKEIRDFRRGIVQLQWERERAEMEADDLVERTKEFQLLRVTKDLQHLIRGGSEDNQQAELHVQTRSLAPTRSSRSLRHLTSQRRFRFLSRRTCARRTASLFRSGSWSLWF